MNCAAALEAILEAEPSELAGQGTTSLAAHLATCERCQAVAHQIVVETRLLAVSVVPSGSPGGMRHSAPLWVRRSLVPAGIAAAIIVALAQRTPDVLVNAPVGAASSLPAVAVPDSASPSKTVADAAPVSVRRRASVRAYPAPVPVAAVRMNPRSQVAPTRAEEGAAVIVDPPAGRRVAVMRTANPKFTVVWLY
jgi:hypothetical protein